MEHMRRRISVLKSFPGVNSQIISLVCLFLNIMFILAKFASNYIRNNQAFCVR